MTDIYAPQRLGAWKSNEMVEEASVLQLRFKADYMRMQCPEERQIDSCGYKVVPGHRSIDDLCYKVYIDVVHAAGR